jgi:hypothetical protein
LNGSYPPPSGRMMTNEELEEYLTDILGVQRPTTTNDNISFGGDVPQPIKAVTSSPSKWIFVGKTLLGPSRYEGSVQVNASPVHSRPPTQVSIHVKRLANQTHSTFCPSLDKSTRICRTASECRKSSARNKRKVVNIATSTVTNTAPPSLDT